MAKVPVVKRLELVADNSAGLAQADELGGNLP
jgi:hypothetical protein